jgi:hypothetical protein
MEEKIQPILLEMILEGFQDRHLIIIVKLELKQMSRLVLNQKFEHQIGLVSNRVINLEVFAHHPQK